MKTDSHNRDKWSCPIASFKRNIERAKAVYGRIRNHWLARGGALEAHDRLSVVTVAAGVREYAFLTDIEASSQTVVAHLLEAAGLSARPCCSRFDINFEVDSISSATVQMYRKVVGERDPLAGLGIWLRGSPSFCADMRSLGAALGYPHCCELMDLQTKQKDHTLFLESIVGSEGDEPTRVEEALRSRRQYGKATEEHIEKWEKRFAATCDIFPFVLHTACDDCLNSSNSPSGAVNRQHEEIAIAVSEELHLMVRWEARALSYQPDGT